MDEITNVNAYVKNEQAAQKMAEKLSSRKTSSTKSKSQDMRLASIKNKMRLGKRLSGLDKSYLRKASPQLLQKAVAAEKKRDRIEQQLKQCKTKEDFYRLRAQVTQCVSVSAQLPESFLGQGSSADISMGVQALSVENAVAQAAPVVTAGENGAAQTAAGQEAPASLQSGSAGTFSASDERHDAVNYSYRAADDAYRSFRHGRKFANLPHSAKVIKGKKLSTKA